MVTNDVNKNKTPALEILELIEKLSRFLTLYAKLSGRAMCLVFGLNYTTAFI